MGFAADQNDSKHTMTNTPMFLCCSIKHVHLILRLSSYEITRKNKIQLAIIRDVFFFSISEAMLMFTLYVQANYESLIASINNKQKH